MGLPFRVLPPPELLTLALVAATLAGIIKLELHRAAVDETPSPAAAASQRAAAPMAPGPRNEPGDQVARQVATILARPLFSPSRRSENAAPVPVHGTAPALPRLAGVMVSPDGKSAIFAGTGGGKPVVIQEGAHIGEYVVGSIDVGTVTIVGPGGHRVLRPAFDPNPAPKTVSVVPAIEPSAPPRPEIPEELVAQLQQAVRDSQRRGQPPRE